MRIFLRVYDVSSLCSARKGGCYGGKGKKGKKGKRRKKERGRGKGWSGVGKDGICKDCLRVFTSFREAFCLAQGYGFAFLLSLLFLSQWLTVLAISQVGPREDKLPKGRRPEQALRKWTSLETTTMGPGLPSCTPGYGFPKPGETLGYQGLGHC